LKPKRGRGEKAERHQDGADSAQSDAEPNEGADPGDDRCRRQYDRDLSEPAAELEMLEPAVCQFARLDCGVRSLLQRV